MSWNAGTGEKVVLCKVNSQPEILTDLEMKASHEDHPSLSATIRNLNYDPVSSTSFSTALLERSAYSGTKNSPIDGADHRPLFAIDDIVDHSQETGNYRSKPGDRKPWIEVALTAPVQVAGLEITTYGATNNRRFEKVVVRAGLVQSPVGGPGTGNSVRNHNPRVTEYVDKAERGEVILLTFPSPVTARYILIQANGSPADSFPTDSVILELAEVRVIKCKWRDDILLSYCRTF